VNAGGLGVAGCTPAGEMGVGAVVSNVGMVTLLEAADAGPVPDPFVAVTVIV
jgi:hypothetical protein